MRRLASIIGSVGLLLLDPSVAGEPALTTNEAPKTSELRKELSFGTSDNDLREKILKLIPLGTSEVDAKPLLRKHLPAKTQEKCNVGGPPPQLPENLRGKPYLCYRLLSEFNLRHMGTQWLEAVFFFENGKLIEVRVIRGSVSL